MEDASRLWSRVLEFLSGRLSKPSFETWLKSTTARYTEDQMLLVMADTEFGRDWLEARYESLIEEAVYSVTGGDIRISYGVKTGGDRKRVLPLETVNLPHTFENFVVRTENRFAHAVAYSVAQAPGAAYNPVFIYGETSVGKTHLLHAIGNYIKTKTPDATVIYVTAEQFMNEFIESIHHQTMGAFRQKYYQADVLLFDDIQCLAGKDQTQEQFFHTFNTLHSEGKQLVITSDRPAQDISALDRKLQARLGWGVTVDMQPAGSQEQEMPDSLETVISPGDGQDKVDLILEKLDALLMLAEGQSEREEEDTLSVEEEVVLLRGQVRLLLERVEKLEQEVKSLKV